MLPVAAPLSLVPCRRCKSPHMKFLSGTFKPLTIYCPVCRFTHDFGDLGVLEAAILWNDPAFPFANFEARLQAALAEGVPHAGVPLWNGSFATVDQVNDLPHITHKAYISLRAPYPIDDMGGSYLSSIELIIPIMLQAAGIPDQHRIKLLSTWNRLSHWMVDFQIDPPVLP